MLSSAAVTPASPSVALRFTEDLDGSGDWSDGDRAPEAVQTLLVPWADIARPIEVHAEGGEARFNGLPPGDYAIHVYWPAGFIDPQTGDEVPHILRIVFRVTADGGVAVPDPLPDAWPYFGDEPFDPATDGTVLGNPPAILLARKDPGVLPFQTDTMPVSVGVGEIDVADALREAHAGTPTPGVTPIRTISTDFSLTSRIVQDSDSNGIVSVHDVPGDTRVSLIGSGCGNPLATDANGEFRWEQIPPGEYELWVWWGPGFINAASVPTNDGLVRATLSVSPDGTVTGRVPDVYLGNVKPDGVIAYPIRSGGSVEDAAAPVGVVYVTARGRCGGASALPSAGGQSASRDANTVLVIAIVTLAAVLSSGSVAFIRRR